MRTGWGCVQTCSAKPLDIVRLFAPGEHGTSIMLYRDSYSLNVGMYRVGFAKNGGTFLGIPRIGIMIFWGLCWGPPIYGFYEVSIVVN